MANYKQSKALVRWYAEYPEKWDNEKLYLAQEILDRVPDGKSLVLLDSNSIHNCESCQLPCISEVRGIDSRQLKEIMEEWLTFKKSRV